MLLANGVSFFYRSGAGSIMRDNAFSTSIRTPNSRIVRGAEGYGINHVDENGYLNDNDLPLNENYILLMGSSHAEGLQVMQKDNMASVLNQMLDDDARTVYNLGTAGYTLPLIIEGFQAALEEFPNSSAILIEISELSFSKAELKQALSQTQFSPNSTGQALVKAQSVSRQLRNSILEALPVISQLRAQFESVDYGFEGAFGIDFDKLGKTVVDAADGTAESAPENEATGNVDKQTTSQETVKFEDLLNQAFAMMRAEYDRPIILLYHPALQIKRNGEMKLVREEGPYDEYVAVCRNNGIDFVDTGDAFLAAYKADYTVPYGFQNTTIGAGHLNAAGHKIVAEAFYNALMETQGKGNE